MTKRVGTEASGRSARRAAPASATAVALVAAVVFAGYVYAGDVAPKQSGRTAESRPRVDLDASTLGTLSPRALNILHTERRVDASMVVRTGRGVTRGPSPGVSAGVAALARRARAPAAIPDEVRRFVDHTARMTRTDPAHALATVRVLRSGLGSSRASVYAYRSSSGSPCFVLTGYGGACAHDPRRGMPGLHWTIGGGHDSVPSVLVGIASDDVSRVELRVDGAAVPVSLASNTVFAEFPRSAGRATIVVVHASGATSETTLGL